jgi:hypothetical protein
MRKLKKTGYRVFGFVNFCLSVSIMYLGFSYKSHGAFLVSCCKAELRSVFSAVVYFLFLPLGGAEIGVQRRSVFLVHAAMRSCGRCSAP